MPSQPTSATFADKALRHSRRGGALAAETGGDLFHHPVRFLGVREASLPLGFRSLGGAVRAATIASSEPGLRCLTRDT